MRPEPAAPVRAEVRRLLQLAVPVIIANLGTMLLGVVDTLMVGHVSVEALGAASLGHLWVFGTLIFGMGLVFGIDPLVSQAHGARDERLLGLTLQRGLILALAASLPIAVSWLFTRPALVAVGQDPALAELARVYVEVQLPSIPAFLLFITLRQYLQGRGIVRPVMWTVLAANLVNVLLNWALIFGHLGAPPLGIYGAGLATSLTRFFMVAALGALFLLGRLHRDGWVPWSRESLQVAGLRDVLHLGLPVALHLTLEVWAFQAATLLAGWLGAVSLAAHTVVLNLASVTFMLPLGVSFGAVTRVGNLIGAGEPQRAQRAAWVALALGASSMSLSAVAFLLLREQLPRIYTPEVEVIALGASILPIAAAFQLFDGVQVVGAGILRGMGRTRPAALFNVVGFYGLALPLAWYLARPRQLGLVGIWWGLALGLASVAAFFLLWVWRWGPRTVPAGGLARRPLGAAPGKEAA